MILPTTVFNIYKTCFFFRAHSTDGKSLINSNMESRETFKVHIVHGYGEISYPEAFKKKDGMTTTIQCHSLYVPAVPQSSNEPLFLKCGNSYHRDENFSIELNILAMFQAKNSTNLYHFSSCGLPLTRTVDIIPIYIQDIGNNIKDINAIAVFELNGKVRDKLFLI